MVNMTDKIAALGEHICCNGNTCLKSKQMFTTYINKCQERKKQGSGVESNKELFQLRL